MPAGYLLYRSPCSIARSVGRSVDRREVASGLHVPQKVGLLLHTRRIHYSKGGNCTTEIPPLALEVIAFGREMDFFTAAAATVH